MRVRERMPLRLNGEVQVFNGPYARWAGDARDPNNLPNGLSFSTTMPGGFESASVSLPRDMRRFFADIGEFDTVRWKGVGGDIAWEGRIQASPRQSGDQSSVNVELVGWQSHLDDNTSAREIYIDSSFANWTAITSSLKAADYIAGADADDGSTVSDPTTGLPALSVGFSGPWVRTHECKMMYDAKGIPLSSLYYAWMRPADPTGTTASAIDPADNNWNWYVYLAHDPNQTAYQIVTTLRAAGPGSGVFTPTDPAHTVAYVLLSYQGGGGIEAVNYALNWTFLGVVGRSGIPIAGALGQSGGIGVLASDVVANALARWAPLLDFSIGPTGTIQPTTFVIPQAAYFDPTTVSEMIKDVSKYDLLDWAVWEGPMYYMNGWGQRGRNWVSRVREAQLADTGPQVDRIYNGVIITYADEVGTSRSVGPPGANTQYTDASLYDPDPANPATAAGITRYTPPLNVNTSELQGAISIGARYLEELKSSNTAGQANLIGYVEDATTGVSWPSWMVRAGDWITFLDASDTSARRIVKTQYDDASKANSISLDSPPDDIQALLERMNAFELNIS